MRSQIHVAANVASFARRPPNLERSRSSIQKAEILDHETLVYTLNRKWMQSPSWTT